MPTTCGISRSPCPPTWETKSPGYSTRSIAPGLNRPRAYDDGSAARLMMQDVLVLRDSQTVADAVEFLRRLGGLPAQTDRLFVVDSRNIRVDSCRCALMMADAGAGVTR